MSNEQLTEEAQAALDAYLQAHEDRLKEEIDEANENNRKRWVQLLGGNIIVLAGGALGLLKTVTKTAENAAVHAVTAPTGIVSSLVSTQVETINSSLTEANTSLGKVQEITENLDEEAEQIRTTLKSQAELAIGRIQQLGTNKLKGADTELATFQEKLEAELGASQSRFAEREREIDRDLSAQQDRLAEVAEQGETLATSIAQLEALFKGDVQLQIRRFTEIGKDLFDGAESNEKLDRLLQVEESISSVEELVVPVGAVIAWWGDIASIPEGFELCDGRSPQPGSTLPGPKPDLVGRFPRGGPATALEQSDLERNGADMVEGLMTKGVSLSPDQIPAHTHKVKDPGHAHEIDDPGHSHGLPMGDGDGGTRDRVADGDNREHRAVGTRKSGTGIKVERGESNLTVLAAGGGKPHAHAVEAFDNRPRYQELYYIIRVR